MKGNANPAINLDLDRARGRISNAVVGIFGKDGIFPIEVVVETARTEYAQKMRILGIEFSFVDGGLEIKKARPFTP